MILRLAVLLVGGLVVAAPSAAEPMHLVVSGRTRTFAIERPPGETARPTIILLHGLGGTGADTGRQTGLDEVAPRNGFVAVLPDGLRNRWNHFLPGKEPEVFIKREIGFVPDDVGFIKSLVADLVRRGIADPKRIYLAGASSGSFMTLRMVCAEAGLFAAAGLLVSGMPEVLGAECRPARPMPVLMVNGTADQVVPYAGGMVQPGNAFTAWPAERLVRFFRERNGCAAVAEEFLVPNMPRRTELLRWTKCTGGAVVFYRVVGGDHVAPNDFAIGQLLVDFFRDKVRDDGAIATAPSAAGARPHEPPADGARGRAPTVGETFEKHNLLGTFALDCGKPVSRENRYYVHRLLDAGRVQREMMSGPATRDFLVIFERGSELRPNQIALAGSRDGQLVESIYLVEPSRARVLESTVAGRKEITGGRFVGGGETPWMNKCGAR